MFTEPRRRRRAILIAIATLTFLIASSIALSRPQAASQPLSTVTASPGAVEALSRRYTDVNLWSGMEQAAHRYEEQKIEYIQAVIAERERAAAAAAAAKREQQRRAAAAAAAQRSPAAAPRSSAPAYSGDVWHALAMCETGGKMNNPNTGNGYYGYFQFSLGTWQSVGGTGYPHEHSYETQKAFAQKLQARSGWGQWPACSRKLGLR